mmetsp:Transcript_11476/g.29039  ORF Transcript_11476/g.29039 Transcript_11476/m.29039 type:complete len:243 (-) Transcript_11476:347-1075(-)
MSSNGIMTLWRLTFPIPTPLYPANAACTALCARWLISRLSFATGGCVRIIEHGSMYLTLICPPAAVKCSVILLFKNSPTSGNALFPFFPFPATSAPFATAGIASIAAPSDTTITQYPFCFSRSFTACSSPCEPSSSTLASGISTKSTSCEPSAVLTATCPQRFPGTFTRPTPLMADFASTRADFTALMAFSTAVSPPKDLSTMARSLSTVLGMPQSATFSLRRRISTRSFEAMTCAKSEPMK